jgi:preprotein translocase subunit Sss1
MIYILPTIIIAAGILVLARRVVISKNLESLYSQYNLCIKYCNKYIVIIGCSLVVIGLVGFIINILSQPTGQP